MLILIFIAYFIQILEDLFWMTIHVGCILSVSNENIFDRKLFYCFTWQNGLFEVKKKDIKIINIYFEWDQRTETNQINFLSSLIDFIDFPRKTKSICTPTDWLIRH